MVSHAPIIAFYVQFPLGARPERSRHLDTREAALEVAKQSSQPRFGPPAVAVVEMVDGIDGRRIEGAALDAEIARLR